MAVELKLDVYVNDKKIREAFEKLVNDDTMYEIHDLFAKMCDPYVPMAEGVLAQTLDVSKDSVHYNTPYAHYMYVGEVYGPNIPIIEDGIVVGFFSISGKQKEPTGREIQYNTEYHPKASKEWDKAMMSEQGDEFLTKVKEILLQRCKELYG